MATASQVPPRVPATGVRPAAGRLEFYFLSAVVLSLLLLPPVFRGLPFMSRGVRLDQLLVLGALPLLLVTRPRTSARMLMHPISMALLAFALSSAISGLVAGISLQGAELGIVAAVTWGQTRPFLVFLAAAVAAAWIPLHKRAGVFVVSFVAGAAVVALAVAQFFRISPFYELSLEWFARKTGQDIVAEAVALGRVYGTFDGQPNSFGTFCWMLLVLVIGYACLRGRRRGRGWWWLAGLAFLSAVGLLLSWSRGAYAAGALAVALVVLAVPLSRQVRMSLVAVPIGLLLFQIVPPRAVLRLVQLMTASGYEGESIFADRLPYWRQNIDLWTQAPIFGARGLPAAPMDNLYIALLSMNGLFGLAVFIALMVVVAIALARRARQPEQRYATIPLGVITIGLLVNGVSTSSFFVERVEELYWLLIGVALAPNPVVLSPMALAPNPMDERPDGSAGWQAMR